MKPFLKLVAASKGRSMTNPRSSWRKQAFFCCLVGYLLLLSACSGASSSTSAPSPTPRATPSAAAVAPGTVLYQADWSHGFAGWQVAGNWKATQGYLQSDAGNNSSLTMPYRPVVPNYTVEFRLQVVQVPRDGGFFVLAAAPQSGKDGYQAAVDGLLKPGHTTSGLHPQLRLLIDPYSSMEIGSVQVHDYEPGSDWRTYSVEVFKWHATFLVNGARNSQAVTTKTDYLSNGPIHLDCGGAILRVSDFRVTAL